ncbi:metal ABC transporter solute-binding protein, Zn/Mn family [Mesobacillus maritimus]|uniref:metal ABC transporter solute-binding protein, Zn/Mn family n=1 Tax=Mesobacillus maritimus TaxID=1643336 RepID=UPI00384DB111
MKRYPFYGAIGLLIALLLTGCAEDTREESNNTDVLQVYTTVYPLQFFTEEIGGEHVEVASIYPPGADEHTFEPSQKDMMNIADADVFFYVGLGLEGFVEKVKGTLQNEKVVLHGAGEQIDIDHDDAEHEEEHAEEEEHHDEDTHHSEEEEHEHGGVDPHVWIDPFYAKELAKSIKDQLTEQLPAHSELFEENYEKLATNLDQLDAQFTELVETAKHKEIIVAHSAYGYWETRYGIKQISISGVSTTSEPSQKELQTLIEHGKEAGLNYVLSEQNYQSKLADIVQKELGAQSLTLHNLSVLTNDDIAKDETYFSIMEKNLQTLEKALNE